MLVYFLDGSDLPVANGDSYATVSDIDILLKSNASTCGWFNLTDPLDKEALIISATQKLDKFFLKGNPIDETQPLSFPVNAIADYVYGYAYSDQRAKRYYGIKEQKKLLKISVAIQIEADMQKGSISQTNVSQGSESVTDRFFNVHYLAKKQIVRFIA